MAGVIGIDADRARLAVVEHIQGETVRYTIDRRNAKGGVCEGYSRSLGYLMDRAKGARAVVFLEGIFLPSKGNAMRNVETFRVLANVQGEVLYEAERRGVEVRRVPPTEWQKRILGFCRDREKLKAASRVEARRLLRSYELTEHESDAACICLYGMWALRQEESA